MKLLLLTLLVMYASGTTEAARILGLFDYPGKSHFIMFEEVMKTLAARGHEVTVYSHYPQQEPVTNYKDVSLVGSVPSVVNGIPMDDTFGTDDLHVTLNLLERLTVEACDKILMFPAMQQLIKSDEKFDLIFTEAFTTNCMLPFVHKFQTPNIALSSSAWLPWIPKRFGLPNNPSYLPVLFVQSSDHMGFFERVKNTWFLLYSKWFYNKYIDEPTNKIVKRYFGDSLPPLSEIAKNTSMLFVNTNPALNSPKPLVPAVVEVGGIHVKSVNKLPEDIQKFMDEAEYGVIYFTFGSTVQSQDLPEEKRKAILAAFAELPQRVLWKWEADTLPGKPSNVLVRKWMPQYDILSHPKTRLFITHGGLMGTIEAMHNGVPLLGIPLFGDQPSNVMMCVRRGIALRLAFADISKKSLLDAIHTLLTDSGYKERAEKLSLAYKDRPMPPREAVVYWSEYVIRHRGAQHMRSAAVDLEWYQLLLLDVIAAALLACLAVVASAALLVRLLLRKARLLKASPQEAGAQPKSNKSKQQ